MVTNENIWTPQKAAIKLNRILDTFHTVHGGNRFPINIDEMALNAADLFNWSDPITEIVPFSGASFEGMLASDDQKTKWILAFNPSLSEGRVNFTKAHELGHYILHRMKQDQFTCSKDDMLDWFKEGSIESEADVFASYLLMPLNDFREQIQDRPNLTVLGHCAERYGVSLTASILKWLSYTKKKAVLIISNDGFINWASSSKSALKSGAFFKTKSNVIPIPSSSITADSNIRFEKNGIKAPAKSWFPHADSDSDLLEMKLYSNQYESTLTLLILPRIADYWPPKN